MPTTTGSLPATFTFSTGQTVDDLMGLHELAELMDDVTIANTVPPVLMDSDYIPPTNSRGVLVISFIAMFVSAIMVTLRIWYSQKKRITKLLYIEDCLILVALALLIGMCGFAIAGVLRWQWGWHGYDITLENAVFNWKATCMSSTSIQSVLQVQCRV